MLNIVSGVVVCFFFSSRRRHTVFKCDWSSDVCSSDLERPPADTTTSFTWRQRVVVSAGGLSALPADADPQQLAMLGINPPTAALLLSEYVDLKPGEWVVQNAANSGVGRWVIAFAKTRGLKTVNIVRRLE